MTTPLNLLFDAAAEFLAGRTIDSAVEAEARRLLVRLGYLGDDAATSAPPDEIERQVAMLRAAARLKRVFALYPRAAPGLMFLGGEADPAVLGPAYAGAPVGSLAGSGVSLKAAFEACVGEGVEYLSQFEAEGDLVAEPDPAVPRPAVFPDCDPPEAGTWPESTRGWVQATRLGDGEPVLLPAERCLRPAGPATEPPPFALGTGCGAGTSFEAAALHGLLELIERDATALWWRGGRPGRPVALEQPAVQEAAELLQRLRGDSRDRRSWLLDITTDLGVPCVAAISVEADGRGFACGHAARPSLAAAARAAVREMCHIELAYDVVAAKRAERGDDALNEADRRHLARATLIDAADCPLLHPQGAPRLYDDPPASDPAAMLTDIVGRVGDAGQEVYVVNLSRAAFAIPVARVVAPGLQLDPCQLVTPRLAGVVAETGGGEFHSRGLALL
jgi:ribosomal protein S12 methylthiotransferase accessory factor